jgi:hypothetical protein
MSVSCVRVSQPNALNSRSRVLYVHHYPSMCTNDRKGIMTFGLSLLGIILASIITVPGMIPLRLTMIVLKSNATAESLLIVTH